MRPAIAKENLLQNREMPMRMLRLALPLVALAAGPAVAQDYPTRTITLIVPQTAGGNTDTLARIFAPAMSKILGQEIVIENKPGAGNVIGTQAVKEAPADGYTLGVGSNSSLTLAPLTKNDLPYDPIADFVGVYNFANVPNGLVVNAELGPKTLKELLDLANEKPGTLNYSSGGTGTTSHFAGAMFVSFGGVADKTTHIPYQGGAEASVAAASGEVQFYVGPLGGNMSGVIDAKKVIPLAVSGGKRVSTMPDVPTFEEAGMPEYTAVGFFGIIAKAGTPSEIVAKLNAAGDEAAKDPEVIKALANQGIEPVVNSPEEFTAQIKSDLDSYKKLVDDGVVKLQ
jgi:tripartite-type tricarboxylate transporter receptor subunit TctC